MRSVVIMLAGLAILAGLWLLMKPQAPTGDTSQTVLDSQVFQLDLATPARPGEGRTLTAAQGTVVQIEVQATSDHEALHLHGYEKHLPLSPDGIVVLTVLADQAGRFELESHTTDELIAVLEVQPR